MVDNIVALTVPKDGMVHVSASIRDGGQAAWLVVDRRALAEAMAAHRFRGATFPAAQVNFDAFVRELEDMLRGAGMVTPEERDDG